MERMTRVIKCKPTVVQWARIRCDDQFNQFVGHMGFGRKSGIPFCCCLEWTLRLLIFRQRNFGTRLCGPDCYSEFVHCTFHRLWYRREHRRKR